MQISNFDLCSKRTKMVCGNSFNDGAIALEPGRAFAIASSMGLEAKVAKILKEEGL